MGKEMFEKPRAELVVKVNDKITYASIEKSPAAKAFTEKLSGELTIEMKDDGAGCIIGELPFVLPDFDAAAKAKAGDIVTFGGGKIAVCHAGGERSFSRIAKLGDPFIKPFVSAFGKGGAKVTFYLEWSE